MISHLMNIFVCDFPPNFNLLSMNSFKKSSDLREFECIYYLWFELEFVTYAAGHSAGLCISLLFHA